MSRKFAAINNSSAISGATLNSGMLRVVLQRHEAREIHRVVAGSGSCMTDAQLLPVLLHVLGMQ